jgi:hypothetical protein
MKEPNWNQTDSHPGKIKSFARNSAPKVPIKKKPATTPISATSIPFQKISNLDISAPAFVRAQIFFRVLDRNGIRLYPLQISRHALNAGKLRTIAPSPRHRLYSIRALLLVM